MKKEKTRFEALGDRMKKYEQNGDEVLMPGLPYIVRLDGRAFHTFTKGLLYPYDADYYRAMTDVARYLVGEMHALVAYVQSDEISLLFHTPDISGQMMFGGRKYKIASVFSGMASSKFMHAISMWEDKKFHNRIPHFDARVTQYPNREEAKNAMLWRSIDAMKNSVNSMAIAEFGHSAILGVNTKDKVRMLEEAGRHWDKMPSEFKDGSFLRRIKITRELTPAELDLIPELHRPAGPITRSDVVRINMPPFKYVCNQEAFLFDGATAETRPSPEKINEILTEMVKLSAQLNFVEVDLHRTWLEERGVEVTVVSVKDLHMNIHWRYK